MNVALIGTKTGYGHVASLNAINSSLLDKGITPLIESAFPEDKLYGYDYLSDFYNYLLKTSLELSNKFTEMLVYARSDKSTKFIEQAKDKIINYIIENNIDILVSFAPFVNYAIANALKYVNKNVRFVTVVTDPFLPYMVGYDCPDIHYFYVASEAVKTDLIKKGIKEDRIINAGFPVAKNFINTLNSQKKEELKKSLGFDNRKILLCNSGAEGNPMFIKHLNAIIKLGNTYQTVLICGKNEFLKKSAHTIVENSQITNIKVMGFIKNMHELLAISDLHITKPGANTIFQSLYSKVPVFVEGSQGTLYQEKGIVNFIVSENLGYFNSDANQIYQNLILTLRDEKLGAYKDNIINLNLKDASSIISEHILKLAN